MVLASVNRPLQPLYDGFYHKSILGGIIILRTSVSSEIMKICIGKLITLHWLEIPTCYINQKLI